MLAKRVIAIVNSSIMEYLIIIIALLCALIGVIGSVVPALPGPPISFVGILLLYFCGEEVSTTTLVVTGIIAAVITVLDYIAPIWLTKKVGGSKLSMWGAGIGMFVGLFLGPLGIILGPFIGALIGELIAGNSDGKALTVAFMSFISFMLTTGIKLVYCLFILVMVIKDCWDIAWQ